MARRGFYSIGKFRLGRYRNRWVVVWNKGRTRHRFTLEAETESEARQALERFARGQDLTKAAADRTMAGIWVAYIADRRLEGRRSVPIMEHNWKALQTRFGHLAPEMISKAVCVEHARARRRDGIAEATILTELRRIRTALQWAVKARLIADMPLIWLPPEPRSRERWLTEAEVRALIDAAVSHHIRLFIILAIATAARSEALLSLTWTRVDLEAGRIYLDDPLAERTGKGRATVPINAMARSALAEAKAAALTPYVIEYAHDRVRSIKTAWRATVKRAGLTDATPHDLRRTAASWMVMAGVPIEEVARYLGHSSPRVTWATYGRFSPDYLKDASNAVNLDLRRSAK